MKKILMLLATFLLVCGANAQTEEGGTGERFFTNSYDYNYVRTSDCWNSFDKSLALIRDRIHSKSKAGTYSDPLQLLAEEENLNKINETIEDCERSYKSQQYVTAEEEFMKAKDTYQEQKFLLFAAHCAWMSVFMARVHPGQECEVRNHAIDVFKQVEVAYPENPEFWGPYLFLLYKDNNKKKLAAQYKQHYDNAELAANAEKERKELAAKAQEIRREIHYIKNSLADCYIGRSLENLQSVIMDINEEIPDNMPERRELALDALVGKADLLYYKKEYDEAEKIYMTLFLSAKDKGQKDYHVFLYNAAACAYYKASHGNFNKPDTHHAIELYKQLEKEIPTEPIRWNDELYKLYTKNGEPDLAEKYNSRLKEDTFEDAGGKSCIRVPLTHPGDYYEQRYDGSPWVETNHNYNVGFYHDEYLFTDRTHGYRITLDEGVLTYNANSGAEDPFTFVYNNGDIFKGYVYFKYKFLDENDNSDGYHMGTLEYNFNRRKLSNITKLEDIYLSGTTMTSSEWKEKAKTEIEQEKAKAEQEKAIMNDLIQKFGKKYVDMLSRGQIGVGMPEGLFNLGVNTHSFNSFDTCTVDKDYGNGTRRFILYRFKTSLDYKPVGHIWLKNGVISSISWY